MSTTSRPVEARPRTIAANGDGAFAGGERLAAEGAAELLGETRVDRLADDAADVVGLEDRSGDVHERLDLRGGGDCRDGSRRPRRGAAAAPRGGASSPPGPGRYPGGNLTECSCAPFSY